MNLFSVTCLLNGSSQSKQASTLVREFAACAFCGTLPLSHRRRINLSYGSFEGGSFYHSA